MTNVEGVLNKEKKLNRGNFLIRNFRNDKK